MKFRITLLIFSTVLLYAQPMSHDKFIKYKQMAPEIIDIINNQTKVIISCFEREKSLKNMNKCITISETMIVKLIPKQTNKICTKNSNGKLSFIWSDENYAMIISELNKTIYKYKQNKQCLVKSQTGEDYLQCVNGIK